MGAKITQAIYSVLSAAKKTDLYSQGTGAKIIQNIYPKEQVHK